MLPVHCGERNERARADSKLDNVLSDVVRPSFIFEANLQSGMANGRFKFLKSWDMGGCARRTNKYKIVTADQRFV